MRRDDWIALGLIAVLAYALYLGSGGTSQRSPRAAPSRAPGPRQAPLLVRLWRALRLAVAAVILVLACLLAAARARLAASLRRGRRLRGR